MLKNAEKDADLISFLFWSGAKTFLYIFLFFAGLQKRF